MPLIKFNLLIGKTDYMHYQESMKEQTPMLKIIKMIHIFHHHCFPLVCISVAIFTNPQSFCHSKWKGKNNFEQTRIDAHGGTKENSILCSFVRICYCLHCKYSHHLKSCLKCMTTFNMLKRWIIRTWFYPTKNSNNKQQMMKKTSRKYDVYIYIIYIYISLRDTLLWIWGTYYDLILK